MSNKNLMVAGIFILWLVIIGGLIGYKEFTIQTGETVLLKTVPVDPRDLFRGDYVILNYEISQLDPSLLPVHGDIDNGKYVYVELEQRGQYWEAIAIHQTRPKTLALKGRTLTTWGNTLRLEYGLESFFVPEGKGKPLEQAQRSGEVGVEVAVDKFGNGVIQTVIIDGEKYSQGRDRWT